MISLWLGVAQLTLRVPGARSRKDHRRVAIGLRDRLRAKFHVSCGVLDGADDPTTVHLGVTVVGNDATVLRAVLQQVENLAGSDARCMLSQFQTEVFPWSGETSVRGWHDSSGDEGAGW